MKCLIGFALATRKFKRVKSFFWGRLRIESELFNPFGVVGLWRRWWGFSPRILSGAILV